MFDVILFDLDGTLTESAPGIINSVRRVYRHYGLPEATDGELRRFIGPPLIESFGRYCGFSEEKAKEAVGVYREYFAEKGLFENAVYPGIPKCLETLRTAGKRLAVATSKPQPFCDRILEHFDLEKYFDAVVGIPLDNEKMTKAEVIGLALKALCKEKPSSAVMVGDREYDVLGAAKNGIPCVGVLYGYGARDELERAGAAAICENVGQLCSFLLK